MPDPYTNEELQLAVDLTKTVLPLTKPIVLGDANAIAEFFGVIAKKIHDLANTGD